MDDLAKKWKSHNFGSNFVSFYGCVYISQANLTGADIISIMSKAKQVEGQECLCGIGWQMIR